MSIYSEYDKGLPSEAAKEEILTKAPLAQMLRRTRLSERLSLHMPGHLAASAFPPSFCREAISWDTTETALTDNLLAPAEGGAVLAAEAAAASYWGAGGALLLAQGSTQGLQAMLLHYAGRGGRVLLSGATHKAVRQAAAFLELELVTLPPGTADPEEAESLRYPLPQSAGPKTLQAFLEKDQDFSAFLCTSPDYYGQLADIRGLAEVLEAYEIPFLLDAAHGAHLKACRKARGTEDYPVFPVTAAVMSLHKTLPALTGAALLLTKEKEAVAPLRRAADFWGSSSPSLLIAASGDYARAYAEYAGARQAAGLKKALERFSSGLSELYGLNIRQEDYHGDPLRLVINTAAIATGFEAEAYLTARGLVPEMADLCRLVFILPLAFPPEALGFLAEVLNEMAEDFGRRKETRHIAADRRLRAAYARRLFSSSRPGLPAAAGAEEHREQALSEIGPEGAVPAEDIVPYPPGVPLYTAGMTLRPEDGLFLEELAAAGLVPDGCRREKNTLVIYTKKK